MKQVLTMSKLKYQLRPRMSDVKKGNILKSSSTFLRLFVFKKVPTIEIGIAVLAIAIALRLLVPMISAAAQTVPYTPQYSQVASPPVYVVTSFSTSTDTGNTFDPYKEDDIVFASEMEYAAALKGDLERRFYSELVQDNERIIDAVYIYAQDLNKDLVFALLLGESSGKPDAINKNIDPKTGEVKSIDRGLFQLNSRSYPNLTEDQAFQIETNAKYGIAHLRGALQYWGGNVRKALWAYNAGVNGITTGVPKRTINYANDVIAATKAIKQDREQYIKENLKKYLTISMVANKEGE